MKPIIKKIKINLLALREGTIIIRNFTNRGNLQKTWQILKDIIGKKTVSLCHREFLVDGKIIQDKKLIADKFNDYFTNIGPVLAKGIPEVTEKPEDYLSGT